MKTIICSRCKTEKPLTEFRKHRRHCKQCLRELAQAYGQTEAGKAAQKRYQLSNQGQAKRKAREATPRVRAVRLAYALSPKAKAKQKAYNQTEAGRVTVREAVRKYTQTERGKAKTKEWLAKHELTPGRIAKRKIYQKTYSQSEKGRFAATVKVMKRKRLLAATPKEMALTFQQWQDIQARQKGKCYWCKQKVKLTIDHVIPLSKGGQHTALNVVGACLSCNDKKGTKILTLF